MKRILVAACLLVIGCRARVPHAFPNAPVILISIDTLRADHLSIYGAKLVDTPAIDRLAHDGIVFENAYSHVPLTLPSHVSIMTGRLPFQNGVRSNIGYKLDRDLDNTLPRLLAKRGYATGAAVSAYVLRGETGMRSIFDFYDDSMPVWDSATLGAIQRPGNETLRVALNWLSGVEAKPFFLFFHLFEPHSPYEPIEPFKTKYASRPYDGEIATADFYLGEFLDELQKRGLYDKALIVLCGDHGEGLGDHGEAEHGVLLYREELHVPLIVKLPGSNLAGKRVAVPAQLVDILPTIVGAVGGNVPAGLPGMSLVDLAEHPQTRDIYSETMYPRLNLGWSQLRSMTDARDHYIESPVPELYDIVRDPRETNNIRVEDRRQSLALANQLSAIPLNLQQEAPANSEERAKLAALGYLSGAASQSNGPLKNPRDNIGVLQQVQQTFVLNQEGKYRESIELCKQILKSNPDLVDVYTQMAGDYRRLGMLQESLDAYREAVRRSPQLADSVASEVAKLDFDRGDYKAAAANAELAMKLDPKDAHFVLAGIAERQNDLPRAEQEARQALPRIGAMIMLARILAEEHKLDEALAMIERAAGNQGDHPVATISSTRGDILARMGRNQEAEAAFRDEIQRFPATNDSYVMLALLLASEHRFTEIGPTLEAMVKASPVPATYFLAAREMQDLGNNDGARFFRSQGEQMLRAARASHTQ